MLLMAESSSGSLQMYSHRVGEVPARAGGMTRRSAAHPRKKTAFGRFYCQSAGAPVIALDGGTRTYASQEALGSSADASSGQLLFVYGQRDDPSEIDAGAFDSVTLTYAAIPSADREPLTVREQVHFVDGKVLDKTYSAPLQTEPEPCGEN
jgi:hypothetical protein